MTRVISRSLRAATMQPVYWPDGRALQRGGRKPDDHETYSRAQQRRQQADFIFCKW
jgi:hypothetical protein